MDTNPQGHTQAQQEVIDSYQSAVDSGLVRFINKVRSLTNRNYRNSTSYSISEVNARQAADVARLTGVDVAEYDNIITGDAVDHITNRHGENGEHDQNMTDNDIARIGYVLENYDTVELATNRDGSARKSGKWRNGDNSNAPMVIFKKKIDGTIYVVEAVPNSNKQSLAVVSAYIDNNSGGVDGTVLDVAQSAPQATSETPQHAYTSAEGTITQEAEPVKADGRDMGMSRAEVEREYQKLTSELERDMQQGFPWRPTDARMQRMWELGDWLTEHPESGAVYAPAAQTEATADGRDMGETSVSPEDSTGAAPAGFDRVSQRQMEADEYHGVNEEAAQTTLENRGRAPMDIPTTDRNGRQVSKLVSTLVNANITTNEAAAADKMDDLLSRNQSKSVS